ncbi:hypothetical protein PSGK_21145 [Pseudomonas solani]|uniref:hypothetical protein n=1 Tax=Pseudomonas solani TaxID=2731552 RepID=UPI0035BE254C
MFKVSTSGLQQELERLTDIERHHLPVASILAMNQTAYDLRARLVQEMESVFDRPTRYTLTSLEVFPASVLRPVARVWMKDQSFKAQPATRWVSPSVYGGPRLQKRMERQLREKGILPEGRYVVPGAGAKLDAHGNISRGQVTKAMSGIRGFTEVGYDANATTSRRSTRKANGRRYFVMQRGGEPIGIAERIGRGRDAVSIILAFVSAPSYSKALKFFEVADDFVAERLPIRFAEALAKELRYGKR